MFWWVYTLCRAYKIWAATWENQIFAYAKTKTQISFAVTAKLISAFVFATSIVQSLCFLNPKFQVSSHLLWLSSPVCVGPGRKPRRPVFWRRGSCLKTYISAKDEELRCDVMAGYSGLVDILVWEQFTFSLICCSCCLTLNLKMSHGMRKPTMWILTRSDTNQAVQPLEMARGLKFCI